MISPEPREGWHDNLSDATGEAVRFAEMAGVNCHVLRDAGSEHSTPAYLVTAGDPSTYPPGAEVVFTATGRVNDYELPDQPDLPVDPESDEPF
jgi:hypothetical protein